MNVTRRRTWGTQHACRLAAVVAWSLELASLGAVIPSFAHAAGGFAELEPHVEGELGLVKPKGWKVQLTKQGLACFASGSNPAGIVIVEGPLRDREQDADGAIAAQLGRLDNPKVVERWSPSWQRAGVIVDADVAGKRQRMAVLVTLVLGDEGKQEAMVGILTTSGAVQMNKLGGEELLRTVMASVHRATPFPTQALRGVWDSTNATGIVDRMLGGRWIGSATSGTYLRFEFLPPQQYKRTTVEISAGPAVVGTLVTEEIGEYQTSGDTVVLHERRCGYRFYDRLGAYKSSHACTLRPRYLVVSNGEEADTIRVRGLAVRPESSGNTVDDIALLKSGRNSIR